MKKIDVKIIDSCGYLRYKNTTLGVHFLVGNLTAWGLEVGV